VKRPSRGTILRIIIALAVVAYLLYRANPRQVGEALAGVDWKWLGAAIALVFVDRALMALRWIWLLSPIDADKRPPFGSLMRIFFVSTFIGTFLPNSIGSDAVRSWHLAEGGVPMSQAIASVLMDRVLGILSILIAAALGLLLFPELAGGQWVMTVFIIAAMATTGALSVVYSRRSARIAKRMIRMIRVRAIIVKFEKLVDALLQYKHHHGPVTTVLFASVGVQFLRILQAWCLGLSLGLFVPFISYLAFIPVILLLIMLPISVAGLGIAQWSFHWLFVKIAHQLPAPVFALSVLFIALGIVGNLPGLFLFVTGDRSETFLPK
jgi:uncharacterized protein (TIRG00374 family)